MRALRINRRCLRTVAALTLLLYVALLSFAIFPDLHEKLHTSSKHVEHHCVITALTAGQIEFSGVANLLPSAPIFQIVASEVDSAAGVSRFDLLPHGRGPPVISS
jgi:hypothetical protein